KPTKHDRPSPVRAIGTSRRGFLKYVGATFGVSMAPGFLSGCMDRLDLEEHVETLAEELSVGPSIDVVRGEDLVSLRFEFSDNMQVDATGTLVQRIGPGTAYLRVVFP